MQHPDTHIIVGLGETGLSCAHFLKQQQIPFAVMDTRKNPPNLGLFKNLFPGTPIVLGEINLTQLQQAKKIIMSPGISLQDREFINRHLKGSVPILGDIELFALSNKLPVIAITGTNAKSTVTTLVGKMAESAGHKVLVGGNLGVPVLDLLKNADTKTNLYVLELSSFQLETTYSLKPTVASILNVTPDHMDRYKSLDEYRDAKLRIYQHSEKVVCNLDDPLTDVTAQNKFVFTLNEPKRNQFGILTKKAKSYLAFGDQELMPTDELPVIGKHYQANALASLAIGHAYGFDFAPMIKVLREFAGLPHRCELIRELNGVRYINDSKGTNVGATLAAIDGLGSEIKGKLILIAGGIGKNADFAPLLPTIKKYCRHVVLMGEAANDLAVLIDKSVPHSFANSMEEAVKQAQQNAQSNDTVLLSPACASFDMFKNFEHRGEVFAEIVRGL